MTSIAILITSFNRKNKTLNCLNNIFNQETIKKNIVDVYLTNDGCTDGTPESIAELYPQVHIIQGNGNLYWNRGMYIAWQEAAKRDYDFYLWLNDDTYVYPHMLKSLLETAHEKKDKAIIVGATQSKDFRKATYGGRLANGQIPIPDGNLKKVTHFNGNIVLVPRYVFQRLGNLDYYFTHSKGDFDYGMRARKAGIEIYQARTYLGKCEQHESLDKWCNPDIPFRQRWQILHRPNEMPPKETFYLEKKHYGVLKAAYHYCTIYIRCIYPSLWIKLKK